jgi:hypothetical protein
MIAYKHFTRMLREYDSLQALYKNVRRTLVLINISGGSNRLHKCNITSMLREYDSLQALYKNVKRTLVLIYLEDQRDCIQAHYKNVLRI